MTDRTPRPGDAPLESEGNERSESTAQVPLPPAPFDPAAFGPPQPQALIDEQPAVPPVPHAPPAFPVTPAPSAPTDPADPAAEQEKRRLPVEAGLVAGVQFGALQASPAGAPHPQQPLDSAGVQPAASGSLGATATKSGLFATTTAKVVAGCVAAVLVGGTAIAWTAVTQFGSKASGAASSRSDTVGSGDNAADADVVFDPEIIVTEGSITVESTDAAGLQISLTAGSPAPEVTGVDPEIAQKFASTVEDGYFMQLQESLQGFSDITLNECGDVLLEPGAATCARDTQYTLEQAGVYEEYGTVATSSHYVLGSRDRNPGVYSATMDLKTGESAELADFIDINDPSVQRRAEAALGATENWAYCNESAAEYLATSKAFSPSEAGMLLLWPIDRTQTAQCGVDRVVVPWEDAPGINPSGDTAPGGDTAAQASAEPVVEDVNGRWCATPETEFDQGCYTIELPNVTYPNGSTYPISALDARDDLGGFSFTVPGAPFGTYYPAGIALELPDYYSGADIPDQDRIWSGQSGMMLLRE